jgi:hypothetical protein
LSIRCVQPVLDELGNVTADFGEFATLGDPRVDRDGADERKRLDCLKTALVVVSVVIVAVVPDNKEVNDDNDDDDEDDSNWSNAVSFIVSPLQMQIQRNTYH